VVGVCVLLVLAIAAVFGQTARFDFVNYDDNENVYENRVVEKGLSSKAVGWAFTHPQTGNWIPLTTLSHMLDCQLFGLRAGGHHLVNVLWHAANAVLLFLILRQMTGSLWKSALVAAVFAVHPLRAESVAWVSERKDVLSGFFFMLTIGAYVRQVRQPSRAGYLAVVMLFVLGLLAKSMVATLPFALLLLDYWPLGRWQGRQDFRRVVAEKIPLFGLAAGACVATALVPGLIITHAQRLPLLVRIGNALVSYVVYLRQMIFPAGLATPYPLVPSGQPLWRVGLACIVLASVTAALIVWRKKRPCLLMGWLWYLVMLFPVIGIIQISSDAAHADRYTYLPEIGLAMAAAWAIGDWCAGSQPRRALSAGLMITAIGPLTVWGHIQTSHWRDSESLWTRALACTSNNAIAHFNLAITLAHHGKLPDAIEQYRKALAIRPDYMEALNNLGNALARTGQLDDAIDQYGKALKINPASRLDLYDLAVALADKGKTDEAIAQYRKVLERYPNFAEARLNLNILLGKSGRKEENTAQYRKALEIDPNDEKAEYDWGNALATEGKLGEAIAHLRRAVKIKPDYAKACSALGLVFFQKGDIKEAIDSWQQALELKPDQADVQNNLAWLLATSPDASLRQGAQAVALAERANQLNGSTNAAVLHTLAAACAETGRYRDAIATARRALELAVAQKNDDLMAKLPKEIKLYEANTPIRDVPQ